MRAKQPCLGATREERGVGRGVGRGRRHTNRYEACHKFCRATWRRRGQGRKLLESCISRQLFGVRYSTGRRPSSLGAHFSALSSAGTRQAATPVDATGEPPSWSDASLYLPVCQQPPVKVRSKKAPDRLPCEEVDACGGRILFSSRVACGRMLAAGGLALSRIQESRAL